MNLHKCPLCQSFSAHEEKDSDKGDITVIPPEGIEMIFEYLLLDEVFLLCNDIYFKKKTMFKCDKNFWIYTAQRLNLFIEEILIKAIRGNYIEVIDSLLQIDDIIINQQNQDGDTALIIAAKDGHENIVNRLLEVKDIDVDQQNYEGDAAFMMAVQMGHENIVNRLLEVKEIEVNQQNYEGYTALMMAVLEGHENIVNRLLEVKEIDLTAQNYQDGDTALILAVTTPVRLVYGEDGYTASMWASQNKDHWDVYGNITNRLLEVKEIEVNQQNQRGDTALIMAIERASIGSVENFVALLLANKDIEVNQQNQEGDTALMIAVGREYENVVNRLLKDKDIDVNQQNQNGDTALILAVPVQTEPQSHGDEYRAQKEKQTLSIINQLLEVKDIDVNVQDQDGNTALMVAAEDGQLNVVEMLLEEKGINVNLQNQDGNTALLLAAENGQLNVVKMLLAAEKNKKCKTKCKKTPGRGTIYDCTCDTDPYSYFSQTYDWDFCVCPREHDDPFP